HPRHLFDRPVAVEPYARRNGFWFAVVVEDRLAVVANKNLRWNARANAASGPRLARRHKEVRVRWHVGVEIVEGKIFTVALGRRVFGPHLSQNLFRVDVVHHSISRTCSSRSTSSADQA